MRPCVRACVNTFKHEYLCKQQADCKRILSEASLGRGKAALGFWPDRIGTQVSMATDSSHRVIMGENLVSTLAPSFLIGSSSYLQVTRTTIISQTSLNFSQIRPRTAELAALKRLKNISKDLKWGKSC